jgi:hypothetical protein
MVMAIVSEIVRRAGTPFVVMGLGFLVAFVGLADDWYQHEIVGFSTALESFYTPVHLAIFSGVIVAALGYLWGLSRIVSSVRRSETVLATNTGLIGPNPTRR